MQSADYTPCLYAELYIDSVAQLEISKPPPRLQTRILKTPSSIIESYKALLSVLCAQAQAAGRTGHHWSMHQFELGLRILRLCSGVCSQRSWVGNVQVHAGCVRAPCQLICFAAPFPPAMKYYLEASAKLKFTFLKRREYSSQDTPQAPQSRLSLGCWALTSRTGLCKIVLEALVLSRVLLFA